MLVTDVAMCVYSTNDMYNYITYSATTCHYILSLNFQGKFCKDVSWYNFGHNLKPSCFSYGDVPDGSVRTGVSYFEGPIFKSQPTDSSFILVPFIPGGAIPHIRS